MIMGEIRLKIVLTGRAVGRLRRSTMIKHRLKKRERMMRQRMRIGEVNLESDRGGNFLVSFNEWNSIKVCYKYSLFSVNNSHPDSSKYFRYVVETLVWLMHRATFELDGKSVSGSGRKKRQAETAAARKYLDRN